MTKKARQLLFIGLLIIFIIAAPILIGYSMGYTFNFSKLWFEKTGSIFVKSKNSPFSIFLDTKFIKETSILSSGALLPSIKPGTHLLRIEKTDFTSWSKTVTVDPTLVTELRNIILIPARIPIATTTPAEVTLFKQPNPQLNLNLDQKKNLILTDGGKKNIIASGVNSFVLFDNIIYFVNKNGFLARIDDSSTNSVKIIDHSGFYLNSAPMKFIKGPLGKIAIIDSSGGLYLMDTSDTIRALDGNVISIDFDPEEKKLLLLKKDSVSVRWLEDNTLQPFQKENTVETILSKQTSIIDAKWFLKDSAHIIIRAQNGIYITELDGRGGRNTTELISGPTDELITNSQIPNVIFFRRGKTIYKIEL